MSAPESPGLLLAEEACDLVLDYCADGVEAFHSCIGNAIRSSADGSEPELDTRRLLEQVLKGSRQLYDNLTAQASASMQLFREACAASILKTPLRVNTIQAPVTRLLGDVAEELLQGSEAETEEALLERISRLRQEVAEVDQECTELQQEVQRADQRIAACGDASEYVAVGSTMLSSKQTILAIVQAACNLENMLEKAAMQRSMLGRVGAGDKHPLAGFSNVANMSTASVSELANLVGV